jgi:hypothetical protein
MNNKGYGRLSVGGKGNRVRYMAHRLSLELHGVKVEGHVLHSCDNPCCVNPEHLRDGTAKQNIGDARDKYRNNYGDRNGAARFTNEQVRCIRALADLGYTNRCLADMFGASTHYIRRVMVGDRHVIRV